MTFATNPNLSEVLRVPGLLCWNPTGFASEAQWGTKLGYCEDGINFNPNIQVVLCQEEETGAETTNVVYINGTPVVNATLQNFNTTMLARCFPGCGGSLSASYPGTYSAGKDLAATSSIYAPLLFVPNDTANHPCLLLQRAIPVLSSSWGLVLSHSKKMLFNVTFHGIRASSASNGGWYLGALSGAALI